MTSAVLIKCSREDPSLGGVFHQRNSLDLGSNGASLGLQLKEGVIWVTKVREMVSPLDHANFAQPETDRILMFCLHCDPLQGSLLEGWAQHQAVNYLCEERKALGPNIWLQGPLPSLFSFLFSFSLEALITLSAFSLVSGTPYESHFLLFPSSWESWGGSGSVVFQRKQAYSSDGSLRRLWILRSLEMLTIWHILATMSNNS